MIRAVALAWLALVPGGGDVGGRPLEFELFVFNKLDNAAEHEAARK